MVLNMRKFWIWNWFQMKFIEKIYHMTLIYKSIFYMNENKFWQNLCFFTCSFELSQKTHWHLCCVPPPARRAPIREPWTAANQGAVKSKIVTFETLAMKHLADHTLELLLADEVLNEKKDLENRRNTSMGRSSELDFLRNKW